MLDALLRLKRISESTARHWAKACSRRHAPAKRGVFVECDSLIRALIPGKKSKDNHPTIDTRGEIEQQKTVGVLVLISRKGRNETKGMGEKG